MANNLGGYWKLAVVLKNLTKHEQKSRGTATVRDVDNEGIVWVTPSGTDEAVPAAGVNVASVSVGDVVTVENNGGRLSIVGNATEPAVGQLTVNTTVNQVVETARESIARVIDVVSDVASEARKVAEATGQHFFADDSGIHVTEAEGDPDTDHNILINSLGMLLRLATDPLVSITASATEFYDGLGDLAGNVVAKFGRAGATIGKVADYHTVVNTAGLWFGKATDRLFKVWVESGTSALYLGTSDLVEGDDEVTALDTEGAAASTETEIPGVLLSAPQSGASSVYARYIDFGNANLRYGRVQADASYVYITSRPTGDERTQWRLHKSNGTIQYRKYASGAWGIWSSPFWYAPTSRSANTVLAAPNGSAGGASFRSLVAADLPTVPISKGGTGKTTAADARGALGITRANITLDSTGCTTKTFFSGLSIAKGGVIGTDTGIFDYRFFYITLASSGWCICYRSGSSSTAGTIRGVGAYNDASITYLYEVTIAVSTAGRMTLTVAARHKQLGSSSTTPDGGELNLSGVYGIY